MTPSSCACAAHATRRALQASFIAAQVTWLRTSVLFSERLKKLLIPVLSAAAIIALPFLPRIEIPNYFDFADQRSLFGVPNFWNVASNLPFLFVACWACACCGARKRSSSHGRGSPTSHYSPVSAW